MSLNISRIVERYLILHGAQAGKERLAKVSGRTVRTVDRWIKYGFPKSNCTYLIAIECGLKKSDAMKLACSDELLDGD